MTSRLRHWWLTRPSLLLACTEFLQSGTTAFVAGPIMGQTSTSPEEFSLIAAALPTWFAMSLLLPRYPAPRKFLVTGFASLAIFGTLLACLDTSANPWADILPALAFNSIVLLTVLPTTAMQTFKGLEHDDCLFANAQQRSNMMSPGSIALGITMTTMGQQWRTAVHESVLNAEVSLVKSNFVATLQQVQDALTATVGPAQAARLAMALTVQMLPQQAAMQAHIDHVIVIVIAVLGLLGAVVLMISSLWRRGQ